MPRECGNCFTAKFWRRGIWKLLCREVLEAWRLEIALPQRLEPWEYGNYFTERSEAVKVCLLTIWFLILDIAGARYLLYDYKLRELKIPGQQTLFPWVFRFHKLLNAIQENHSIL